MSTAIILIALGFLLWSGPTQAHARLDHASPAAGSTLSSSPSEIALYFTEELAPKLSGAEARSATGAHVHHGCEHQRQSDAS